MAAQWSAPTLNGVTRPTTSTSSSTASRSSGTGRLRRRLQRRLLLRRGEFGIEIGMLPLNAETLAGANEASRSSSTSSSSSRGTEGGSSDAELLSAAIPESPTTFGRHGHPRTWRRSGRAASRDASRPVRQGRALQPHRPYATAAEVPQPAARWPRRALDRRSRQSLALSGGSWQGRALRAGPGAGIPDAADPQVRRAGHDRRHRGRAPGRRHSAHPHQPDRIVCRSSPLLFFLQPARRSRIRDCRAGCRVRCSNRAVSKSKSERCRIWSRSVSRRQGSSLVRRTYAKRCMKRHPPSEEC